MSECGICGEHYVEGDSTILGAPTATEPWVCYLCHPDPALSSPVRPRELSDDIYLYAVQHALEAGKTDPGAGVPPPAITEFVHVSTETARRKLRALAADGELTIHTSIGLGSGRAGRPTYLPSDESPS